MHWHWFVMEFQMFHTMDFVIYAENEEAALKKLKGWCYSQVEETRRTFEGRPDQEYFIRFTRGYWDTGLQNGQYMKRRVAFIQNARYIA